MQCEDPVLFEEVSTLRFMYPTGENIPYAKSLGKRLLTWSKNEYGYAASTMLREIRSVAVNLEIALHRVKLQTTHHLNPENGVCSRCGFDAVEWYVVERGRKRTFKDQPLCVAMSDA